MWRQKRIINKKIDRLGDDTVIDTKKVTQEYSSDDKNEDTETELEKEQDEYTNMDTEEYPPKKKE